MMPPTPIALAVVEHAGRYLIGQRPEGVPLAGYWEFPGGKVEANETVEQAAVRECREEAALDVVVVAEYPAVVQQYDHDRVRVHFLRCKPTQFDPATGEPPTPGGYRWVAGAELRNYTFPKANDGLIAMLADGSDDGRSSARETR
jgi:8-oxo-dGTP diphosphatase